LWVDLNPPVRPERSCLVVSMSLIALGLRN
jgi:hypothetical protein